MATAVTSAVVTSFSVFHVAIAEDRGWERAQAAGALALASLVTGFSGVVIGSAVDRLGGRAVMLAGTVAVAGGLSLASFSVAPWQLYISYGLIAALGTACLSSIPQNVLLAERFSAGRGAAFGITAAGAGVGTLALVPLAQLLIGEVGWRMAYLVLAAIVGLTAPFLQVALRPMPRLAANPGRPASAQVRLPPLAVGRSIASVLPLPVILMVSATFFSGVQRTVIVVHFVPYLVSIGGATPVAVGAFVTADLLRSFSGAFSGFVTDRCGACLVYVLTCGAAAGSIVLLARATEPDAVVLFALACLYGIASGGILPASSSIQASIYRREFRGRLFGLSSMTYGVGSGFGAWVGGAVFDATGQYRGALDVAATALVLMSLAAWQATVQHQVAKVDSSA